MREQLADSAEDLNRLIEFITRRVLGESAECESTIACVQQWIETNLPGNYEWPGNVRELEQCVRNIIVHNHYQPRDPQTGDSGTPVGRVQQVFAQARVPLEEIQAQYCTLAYWKTGSFEKAAQRLGIDRRTVRARLDERFLAELNAEGGEPRE